MDKRLISVEITMQEMDKRLTARIDVLFWAMGTLIGVVLAAITLPQVLGFLQSKRERAEIQQQIRDQRAETQQQIQDLRVEIRGEIQGYRAEMRQEIRDLGERLERQLQMMFEKLSQHEQEIDELKSRRIVTPS
jgi:hypothetical protein